MLARKIILGFGFAVVLPLLVHYGIEAFHPSVPRIGWQRLLELTEARHAG